jgi:hypothetical protein
MEQRAPPAQYQADLTALLDVIPPVRSVISDLPLFAGRDPYQAVLVELRCAMYPAGGLRRRPWWFGFRSSTSSLIAACSSSVNTRALSPIARVERCLPLRETLLSAIAKNLLPVVGRKTPRSRTAH